MRARACFCVRLLELGIIIKGWKSFEQPLRYECTDWDSWEHPALQWLRNVNIADRAVANLETDRFCGTRGK